MKWFEILGCPGLTFRQSPDSYPRTISKPVAEWAITLSGRAGGLEGSVVRLELSVKEYERREAGSAVPELRVGREREHRSILQA